MLRRVASLPEASELVLRGGMALRLFVENAARPVEDLDFLALFPFDPARTAALVEAACQRAAADEINLRFSASEVIWAETAFPGVRSIARATTPDGELDLQIDVGFGDPLVPDAQEIAYPTGEHEAPVRVRVCRPETLLGWKLHGLYERGPGRWRPKDLFDVHLLLTHASLQSAAIPSAVRSAFESRGDSPALMANLLEGRFGKSPWSARKWASFRRSRPEGSVPEDLGALVASVSAALAPILASPG